MKLVLLTGATGYVGGRLLQALEDEGHAIRCLARDPSRLRTRVGSSVEAVCGDVFDPPSLRAAMKGVSTAYYLVHSMGSRSDFEKADRQAARQFGQAARAAGVKRIIFLGGLAHANDGMSAHLRSRQEVGELLRASGVPVIEFRASIIIGSGSLSYELVRALVERLPLMITPRWVSVIAQPIAIEDVLRYLTAALSLPENGHQTFEIGGQNQVSYEGIMREYARQRGLRRWLIRVPCLTPRLSSLWLGLVTPIYARVGRILINSIRVASVVRDRSAIEVFEFEPMGLKAALDRALRHEDKEVAQTRWSDALSATTEPIDWGGTRFGNRLVDSRAVLAPVSGWQAWQRVQRLGGTNGWYYGNLLWRVRGWADVLLGGVGLRRGRRDPVNLRPGDVLDCWRVQEVEPGRRLLLQAEMKLPGRAWLEFEIEPRESGSAFIRQTAIFDPVGLFGLSYWYALYPIHQLIFAGMLREMSRSGLAPPQTARGKLPISAPLV